MSSSAGANGSYKLLNNPEYPNIVEDFQHTFAVLPTLPCDVFLGAHVRYFNLNAKYAKLQAGDKNAFVDPEGYQAYVANGKQQFERQLKKQTDEAKPANP
jgi:metallo-beta-lactamase class B